MTIVIRFHLFPICTNLQQFSWVCYVQRRRVHTRATYLEARTGRSSDENQLSWLLQIASGWIGNPDSPIKKKWLSLTSHLETGDINESIVLRQIYSKPWYFRMFILCVILNCRGWQISSKYLNVSPSTASGSQGHERCLCRSLSRSESAADPQWFQGNLTKSLEIPRDVCNAALQKCRGTVSVMLYSWPRTRIKKKQTPAKNRLVNTYKKLWKLIETHHLKIGESTISIGHLQ